MPEDLGNEARGAEVQRLLHQAMVVGCSDDDDGHVGVLGAEIDQAREALHARHAQVEQDEVEVVVLCRASARAASSEPAWAMAALATPPVIACFSASRNSGMVIDDQNAGCPHSSGPP